MVSKFKAKDTKIVKMLLSKDDSLLCVQGDDEFIQIFKTSAIISQGNTKYKDQLQAYKTLQGHTQAIIDIELSPSLDS